MQDLRDVWVYLTAGPLLHLSPTLASHQVGTWLYHRAGMKRLCNPAPIVAALAGTGAAQEAYFDAARFVHFLLGPATVALAIPLHRPFARLRRSAPALLASIATGSAADAGSAAPVAGLLGAAPETPASLAPKSATAAVAMGIAEELGGLPSLTAVLAIATGVRGAMPGSPLLTLIGVRDWAARGLALRTASHRIRTARAMQVNGVAGAFSGLAMGINALATALLLPIVDGPFY